jgi:hypothetical protein
VSFAALAGTTYRIAVDGHNGAVGTVALNVDPPGNDDFVARYLITGNSGTTNGYTTGASKEAGEPAHAFDVGGHSVWFRWIAPLSGPVEFNTAGSPFDTTLAVYTGPGMGTLVMRAANDDDTANGLHSSRLSFNAVAGVTYQIAIDGYGGDSGLFNLNWNMVSQLAISGMTNGVFRISFSGVNGQRYALLMSTDLLTWSTQATRTMSGNSQDYIDVVPGRVHFYRTVLLP